MCIQLSIYFNKKIISNLLKPHIFSVNAKVNASTKSKTHYDTLNISPNATHNEIKSAYFKLTIKYHPDKNKSQSAKVLFHEVSEAYEVLSNHKLRKQYDRSIAVRSCQVSQVQKPTATYEYSSLTRSKMYDFDEWTRAHYHNSFESNLKRRHVYKEYVKRKEMLDKHDKASNTNAYGPIAAVLLLFVLFVANLTISNDTVVKKKVD